MEATVPIQDITFCIKTIHRPWACHRLVQSLRKEFGEPKIVVVDDGLPEHWFSRKYPETAKHCKVIDLQQHDVGVGIGRNTAIDAAETEFNRLALETFPCVPYNGFTCLTAGEWRNWQTRMT